MANIGYREMDNSDFFSFCFVVGRGGGKNSFAYFIAKVTQKPGYTGKVFNLSERHIKHFATCE